MMMMMMRMMRMMVMVGVMMMVRYFMRLSNSVSRMTKVLDGAPTHNKVPAG